MGNPVFLRINANIYPTESRTAGLQFIDSLSPSVLRGRTHLLASIRRRWLSEFLKLWYATCNHELRSLQLNRGVAVMTYVMTKPCPVCRQQLVKPRPTDTVRCTCGKHVWQG